MKNFLLFTLCLIFCAGPVFAQSKANPAEVIKAWEKYDNVTKNLKYDVKIKAGDIEATQDGKDFKKYTFEAIEKQRRLRMVFYKAAGDDKPNGLRRIIFKSANEKAKFMETCESAQMICDHISQKLKEAYDKAAKQGGALGAGTLDAYYNDAARINAALDIILLEADPEDWQSIENAQRQNYKAFKNQKLDRRSCLDAQYKDASGEKASLLKESLKNTGEKAFALEGGSLKLI